jgi:hypothetical protein
MFDRIGEQSSPVGSSGTGQIYICHVTPAYRLGVNAFLAIGVTCQPVSDKQYAAKYMPMLATTWVPPSLAIGPAFLSKTPLDASWTQYQMPNSSPD